MVIFHCYVSLPLMFTFPLCGCGSKWPTFHGYEAWPILYIRDLSWVSPEDPRNEHVTYFPVLQVRPCDEFQFFHCFPYKFSQASPFFCLVFNLLCCSHLFPNIFGSMIFPKCCPNDHPCPPVFPTASGWGFGCCHITDLLARCPHGPEEEVRGGLRMSYCFNGFGWYNYSFHGALKPTYYKHRNTYKEL